MTLTGVSTTSAEIIIRVSNRHQVAETSFNVITNSPSQDYTHPDDHTSPIYDLIPRFKPVTKNTMVNNRGGSKALIKKERVNFNLGHKIKKTKHSTCYKSGERCLSPGSTVLNSRFLLFRESKLRNSKPTFVEAPSSVNMQQNIRFKILFYYRV